MNASGQNHNTINQLRAPQPPAELSVLQGGGEALSGAYNADNYVGVIRVEAHVWEDEGDHRVETLTLRNGRRYTCVVTEADFETARDIGGTGLTLLVPGFTEVASAKNSTASTLHKKYADRRPDRRVVSVDRIGYSQYSQAGSHLEAVRFARQHRSRTASDLTEVALHYAEGNPTILVGTSAGHELNLEIVNQNGKDLTRPELTIDNKIYGIAPCVVAKNEEGLAVFRGKESETVTRIKNVLGFGVHCPINVVESTLENPKGTWDSRGILQTWARNPRLLVMLPFQFVGHTEGMNFIDMIDVAAKHTSILASGGKDVVKGEEQNRAINMLHPGSVEQHIDPQHGHISYPIAADEVLDALGIYAKEPRPPAAPTNRVKDGLKLASSAAEEASVLAASALIQASRLGKLVLSPLRQLVG